MPVDGYETVAQIIRARSIAGRPTVVGIAGGVAVGKSTTAETLAALLRPGAAGPVEVVSTDGFLFPNFDLIARGLLYRKGFPESYDTAAIEQFIGALGRGESASVPVYSHQTYDIVPGGGRRIEAANAVLLEGVNALRLTTGLDLAVYVDASEEDMEEWYTLRFLQLCVDPPAGSFYSQFTGMDAAAVRDLAGAVWREVNLVNLRECIEPTRANADVVIEKRADHSVGRVHVRA